MASHPSALPLHLLHLIALQSLSQHGFTSSSLAASHALTDVLAHFLTLLATTAGTYANASGRTDVSLLDGVSAIEELGLGMGELMLELEEAREADEEEEFERQMLEGADGLPPGPRQAGRNGLSDFRAYLSQGLDRDPSDHLRYSFNLPSEDQLKAYLYQQELLKEFASDGTSDEEGGSDEEDVSSASASSSISPVLPTGLLPAPTDKLDPPKIELPSLPFLEDQEDDGVHPFGKHMAHLPAFPSKDPSSSTPAPSFALAAIVPETPLDRATTPVVDEIDSLLPDFLRPIPFASSSLASAGPVVFPTPDDLSKHHHSAPTMAHSATLPALIGAYSALQTAIRADPSSLLASGGYGSTSKNVKRLRAAYHLSFHSAPPETYTPSPSLFGSLPVPSPRTTAIVPQIPPSASGVSLPPEVTRVRSRQVLAGLPTSALTPGGAHRHPNMLGNVLHYIAPPALLGRTSRMTEPKPLVDKGTELHYGPVYESKGVVVTTTGGGVRRVKISKPASTYNKGKGKKKKKGNESDEDFEALLDDEASDDGDFGRKGSVGGLGGGAVAGEEWAEEEIELKVEVKEVPVELRATWDAPVRNFKSDELPFERMRKRPRV